MKHLVKLLIVSQLFSSSILRGAWVTAYTMTPSSVAFVSIKGAAGATNIPDFGFCPDQTVSPVINIGFSFVFDGTAYTQFVMTDNGILIFGNWASLSNCGSNAGATTDIPNNLADVNIPRPFLAPLWEELQFKPVSAFGSGWYKSSGGVCTAEWNMMSWRAPTNGDQITFQVVLYQSTNVIDFNYSQGPSALGTSPTASIGLGAIATGTYYSLNNSGSSPVASSTVNNSSIAAKPATDQRYRWTPSTGLPIALVSFSGHAGERKNTLQWTTATQQNNDYFTVERSADSRIFDLVSEVDGAGNSCVNMDYSITDLMPYEGITYYRLSWTDYNNFTEYSPVISVALQKEDPPDIFPNPVQDLLHFSMISGEGVYSLTNMTGAKVTSGQLSRENPVMDFSAIPEGVYLLTLNGQFHFKIVVKH